MATVLVTLRPDPIDMSNMGRISDSEAAADTVRRMPGCKQPRSAIARRGTDRARQLRRQIAEDVRHAREDAGISKRRLALAAGISCSTLHALEHDAHDPDMTTLARVATALGMNLGVRLYPGTGPAIRDHIQAAMIGALLPRVDRRWMPTPEVVVRNPIFGVIDLVLEASEPPIVACEAQSELRRLEQQIRWSRAKADALAELRGAPVARLLLLRSTPHTRAVLAMYAPLLTAAYPARHADAIAALTSDRPWPGDAIVWCAVEGTSARLLDVPPRGVRLGL